MQGSVSTSLKPVCARCNRRAAVRVEVARVSHTLREYRPAWWIPRTYRRYACQDCLPTLVRSLESNGMYVGPPERIG